MPAVLPEHHARRDQVHPLPRVRGRVPREGPDHGAAGRHVDVVHRPDDVVDQPWELRRGLGGSFSWNRAEGPDHLLSPSEIVGVLTPAVRALADPTARGMLPFSSLRFPEPLLVDGIDVEGHVLWGMTLRLLDDLIPRLLAGEWDV